MGKMNQLTIRGGRTSNPRTTPGESILTAIGRYVLHLFYPTCTLIFLSIQMDMFSIQEI